MAHIIIIGASTGGLPAAYDIKCRLDKTPGEHKVTVVNLNKQFSFVPSNPWVGVGWRKRKDISFGLEKPLYRQGINFIAAAVTNIAPGKQQIELDNGEVLDYDYLVIATGPGLAFDEVKGLGPTEHTHSICTIDHAESAYHGWREFVKRPGPIVVGAAQGASCFGPAYEYAMIMETDLRKRGIRDQVPITFVTPEPYIGHLGLGGVGNSKGMLEDEMRQRHIKWLTNAKISKVEPGKLFVNQLGEDGKIAKKHTLEFGYSMILPAFRGVDVVARAGSSLVNPKGFVKVNEFQQNPRWKNIYAVGVGIAIAPTENTPVPTGTPKTGYMIESMVAAVAHNIGHDIRGEQPEATATWNAFCLADFGDTGAAFVALPQIPPRNLTWAKKAKWVHWAKVAFEKYFLFNMKRGTTEPLFQKFALKVLGISHLKD